MYPDLPGASQGLPSGATGPSQGSAGHGGAGAFPVKVAVARLVPTRAGPGEQGDGKVADAAVRDTRRVLVAADKFKGSLTAVQVAERVTAGLRRVVPDLPVETLPVADGGDGTVDAAVAAGFERREVRVAGPLGQEVSAAFALREGTAVVEMAEASGLQRLPAGVFAPLTASTYGSGELLRAALDAGARTIVFGVGGSATTDGGAGMLCALGARFLDAQGEPVPPGGGALAGLAHADLSGLDRRLASVDLVLASDVDNPLTGPLGAAAVYGPQKGASPDDVETLDAALAHFAKVLEDAVGERAAKCAQSPGAGAAGGIGYGALLLGARFRPGIEVMLDVLGFAPALERASLVITGEGSLDEQTLHGKAPAGVAAAARAAGKEVVAVCGRLALQPAALGRVGIRRAYALTDVEPDVATCIAEAGDVLERLAERVGRDFLL
ncbi:glycerate kinase [Streptomyces naganishii JCM 4654]|uniref:Glycerate kinase n=1 Tax=Streptomyces naganishii JCM 4654 TaxID=1306179 RepID=A0A919CZT7_9ACTN|nr:glycerate kinase [Streptomyces naganishii JCM 4654]